MSSSARSGRGPGWSLLRTTLLQIHTVFGRLVYLASLRNPTSGTYHHELIAHSYGSEEADRILKQQHAEIFSEWLERSLEDQKSDLDEFLAAYRTPTGELSRDLEDMTSFRSLIPASAREIERQLYVTDLETLLELLRFERSGAFWSTEA